VKAILRVLVRQTALAGFLAGPLTGQPAGLRAINPADVDTTCKPCDNFYKFATGGWERRAPIPAAFGSWSSFDELTLRNFDVVRGILESAARDANTTGDADRRKVGRFYATCMDSAAVEARGLEPLREHLRRIDAIGSRAQLREEVFRLHRLGFGVGFFSGASQDAADSRRVIFGVSQGGLGLPDRDYYFSSDSSTLAIRGAYRDHIISLLRLLNVSAVEAASQADQIIALETALADSSLSRLQRRDPRAQYHMMSVADANRNAAGVPWREYLRALGLPSVDSFNVAHPAFFRALGRELESRPLDVWKAYLRFHVANMSSNALGSAFVNQAFAFNARLTGARELQPRWRRCLATADRFLGDALGREYVKVAYTPAARTAMTEMIDNLMTVYRRRLQTLPWMGDATRQQAMKKLDTFGRKIGYPDAWRDYSGLAVEPTGWFENIRRAVAFETARDLAKVGKPVDRGEWLMTPPTVNAYYSPPNNEIAFPAGRLQPPFFHPSFDIAANYGGIGATIGHEVSHGFDDQGRKYDADGNLRDWWTADDAARFGELAARIERQYSDYTVLDSLRLNGRQTLGENIADNAGVSIAFEALQLALKDKPRTLIDGFTPEQRFFLGWAQARRQSWREQALRLQVRTGVHSPGEFRVNGPLSNMPEFAAAFGCKLGDRMVRDPAVRTTIW
jgi:putative endopeptidase